MEVPFMHQKWNLTPSTPIYNEDGTYAMGIVKTMDIIRIGGRGE